jgi:hypothetical protein
VPGWLKVFGHEPCRFRGRAIDSPTIIRMFRDGRAKVSFNEVPDLADVAGLWRRPKQLSS